MKQENLTMDQIIDKEREESTRWKSIVTNIQDIKMDCEDEYVKTLDNKGELVETKKNHDMISISGQLFPFTFTAKNQLLNKLGINHNTFQNLTFDVRKRVVVDRKEQIGDGSNVKIRLRTQDNKSTVGGVVGSRYAIIENHVILEGIKPYVDSGVLELKSGKKAHWMEPFKTMHYRFIVPTTKQDVGRTNQDILAAGLHVRNSNVGVSSLVVEGIVYRTCCENSLTVMDEFFRQKHNTDEMPSVMANFENGLTKSIQSAIELIGKFDATHDQFLGVTSNDLFKKFFKRLEAKTNKQVAELALANYQSNSGMTMYDLINSFTWSCQRLYDVGDPMKRLAIERSVGEFLTNL